jgi:hypothetical protein
MMWLIAPNQQPLSPLPTPQDSPIATPVSPIKVQAAENFDNLDGKGEIKWYDGFFTWNPRAQATSYPFISGTIQIDWQEIEVVPNATAYLVVELELRNESNVYTQTLDTEVYYAPTEPGDGVFYHPLWIWINVTPGVYDEYIQAYWQVSDSTRIPIRLWDDGIIEPDEDGFTWHREVEIPVVIYLPVIMKRAQ